jgi:hypothetical protein
MGMSQTIEKPQSYNNAAITREFGHTEIGALRNIYGRAFAVGLPEHMRLSELIGRMEERGLWQVVQHFEYGNLARRIREAGG